MNKKQKNKMQVKHNYYILASHVKERVELGTFVTCDQPVLCPVKCEMAILSS